MNEPIVERRVDDGSSDMLCPPKGFSGVWEVYWPNGALKFRAVYRDGKEEGECLCLWENGNPCQRGLKVAGECHGVWTDYDHDGNKTLEGEYGPRGKCGIWKTFWPNGCLMYEEEYEDGDQHGIFRVFNWDGLLLHEGEYRRDDPYNGVCRVMTWNSEENYCYLAEFKMGRQIRRLPKDD